MRETRMGDDASCAVSWNAARGGRNSHGVGISLCSSTSIRLVTQHSIAAFSSFYYALCKPRLYSHNIMPVSVIVVSEVSGYSTISSYLQKLGRCVFSSSCLKAGTSCLDHELRVNLSCQRC